MDIKVNKVADEVAKMVDENCSANTLWLVTGYGKYGL